MNKKKEDVRNWLIGKMVKEIMNNKEGEYNLCHMRCATKFNIDFKLFQKIIKDIVFDGSIWDEIRNHPGCSMAKFSIGLDEPHGCRDPDFNSYKSKVDSGIIKDDFSWMVPEDREKYLNGR